MAHWAPCTSWRMIYSCFCLALCLGEVQANVQQVFLASPQYIATNSTSSLVATSRARSSEVPPSVQEILERHARRRQAERNATPSADESVVLRADAVALVDTEYDALLEHVAESLNSFVHEANFASNRSLTNQDLDDLQGKLMLDVADEFEPHFDTSAGLVGSLYDKAKPHKKREYVASLEEYVPEYCEGQRDRVWVLLRSHLTGIYDEEKFKEKLEYAGQYIESGIEDYVELSYYSNLMLHGRNSSQMVNVTRLKSDIHRLDLKMTRLITDA